MEIKNVLSLFDGMSCGQIALGRAGVHYENYYASEIDKYAIQVTQHNHPKTIQLGSVTEIKGTDLPQIDLLIGGSPCQGFSLSGKQLNFEDARSKLFFEFVRLLKECNPKFWLLENVVMKKSYEDIITQHLGVNPIKINSSLVSAQNRNRLYWANFNITKPEDKGIKLIDILEDTEMTTPAAIRGRKLYKGSILATASENKNIPYTQCLEVRGTNTDKSNCLTQVAKDNVLTKMLSGKYPNIVKDNLPFRYYTTNEYCRLQTVPETYFPKFISDNQIKKMIGNGWTVDIIAHIFQNLKQNSKW